jgi:hypothetical protein
MNLSKSNEAARPACALITVERRLNDAVSLWGKALDSYFAPDEFRVNLQSCIQAFRSVTWVLQSQKAHIRGFEDWYSSWQQRMRADPVLRWLVDARNKIEKQGDLDTRSTLKLTFSSTWADATATEKQLPPSTKPDEVAWHLALVVPRENMADEALVKVERRWVDSEMPESEILDALCHCYGTLLEIIIDAHQQLLVSELVECAFADTVKSTNYELPRIMLFASNPRVVWLKLKTGESISIGSESQVYPISESEPVVRRHYGYDSTIMEGLKKAKDFREQCAAWFQLARRHLEVDGYAVPTAVLWTPRTAHFFQLVMLDRAEKHIVIRELADKARRLNAISLMLINEAWVAPVAFASTGKHAIECPNREEALVLHGLTNKGRAVHCHVRFQRKAGKIVFGAEQVTESEPPNIFTPFLSLWKIKRESGR